MPTKAADLAVLLGAGAGTLGSGVTIGSGVTLPAGHVLQIVQSSNDLANVSSITSTSYAQNNSLPYVDITPKATNSKFHMFAKMYGSWNTSIPDLAFAVSTTSGHADSTYTHKIGSSNWSYGSFMTWGVLNGEFTVFFEDWYQSSFTANQTPIRFAIGYRNVYHASLQNAFGLSSGEDNAAHLIVYEIAT